MRQASVKMDVVGVTKRNIADNYHPLVGWGLLIGIWLELHMLVCILYYCLQEAGYTKWKSAPTAKDVANVTLPKNCNPPTFSHTVN